MTSSERSDHGAVYDGRGLIWLAIAIWISLLAGAAWANGLADEQVLAHLSRVGWVSAVACGVWLVSLLLPSARLRAWLMCGLVLALLVLTAYYVSPRSVLTAVTVAAVAILVSRLSLTAEGLPIEARIVAGMAIVAGVVGWLLPFPLHTVRVYFSATIVLAAVVVLRRPLLAPLVKVGGASLERADAWQPVALLASLGLASMGLWLPSLNYDDNAGHLFMVSQLSADAYYRLDVSSQLWALAPWANNVLHSIAAVVAGIEVRAAINLLWLVLGAAAAYRLAMMLSQDRNVSVAASVVYLSHPLVAYFATTMQVDGATAAVLMILLAYLVRHEGRVESAVFLGALFGLLAGLKSSNVVFALVPLLYIGYRGIRAKEYGRLLSMTLVACVVAGSSYFYAYLVTGNPFFPLFNAIFQSPYMEPENFQDGRWHVGVPLSTLWDLTFQTKRYGEHYPGAAGLAFIAIAWAAIPQAIKDPKSRVVFISALVGGALMFWQVQYLRYIFPAIAVLTLLGVVGLRHYLQKAAHLVLLLALAAANFSLMPTTSWILHSDAWTMLLAKGPDEKAAIETRVMPERAALMKIVNDDREACVLIADDSAPFIGGASDRAFATAWYDHRLASVRAEAAKDMSGDAWASLVVALGVSHVIVNPSKDIAIGVGLKSIGYRTIDKVGHLEIWAKPNRRDRICRTKVKHYRDEAQRHLRFGEEQQ